MSAGYQLGKGPINRIIVEKANSVDAECTADIMPFPRDDPH
jgi:hypothetical protein